MNNKFTVLNYLNVGAGQDEWHNQTALNKPYKLLINLDRSVFTGKSQTSTGLVWDFPVKTSLSVDS